MQPWDDPDTRVSNSLPEAHMLHYKEWECQGILSTPK